MKPLFSRASSKNAPKTKNPASGMATAVLMLLIAIALSTFLFLQHLLKTHSAADEQLSQSWAQSYQGQLAQLLQSLDTTLISLASIPELRQAMFEQDRSRLRALEQSLRNNSAYLDVRLQFPGSGSQPQDNDTSNNFTALEHLGRASANQPLPVEFVKLEQQQAFYKAAPVFGPGQSEPTGALLIVIDAKPLLSALVAPESTRAWRAKLVQSLPKSPSLTLYQAGEAEVDASKGYSTAHPNWQLLLGLTPADLQSSPELLYFVLRTLLLLVAALIGMMLIRASMRRLLRKDVELLQQAIRIASPVALNNLDQLQLRELNPLVSPLGNLFLQLETLPRTASSRKPASAQLAAKQETQQPIVEETPAEESSQPKASAPPQGTEPEDKPLPSMFMDEVLDIDILDLDLDLEANTGSQQAPEQTINPEIFRAYDIRGIHNQTLSADTAYWIGRAVGSESLACGEPRIITGRDGRLSSPVLGDALIRGLTDSGCQVTDLGLVPTPLVYFANHTLNASSSVMVTGSHNPADYNGFKIVIAGKTLSDKRITALHQRIIQGNLEQGQGSLQHHDILDDYLNHVALDIAIGKPLKVVADCGNGTAGIIAPRLLEEIGCEIIPLYEEVDGHFPNHHPDPGNPANLQDLIAKVKETGADLGVAFDGDADRLGVVSNSGEVIYPDRLMMLFARDVISRNPGADILYDVKCSRRLASLISRCGGRPVMWKTGHSLMKAKIQETQALLAGEMSGHIYFGERWFGFDDGIYAAARLLEILSMESEPAAKVFARYAVGHTTPEINIPVSESSKFAIMQALEQSSDWGNGNLTNLDGIRVDYPAGWGLIRASNTTPSLVLRFEGDNEDELQRIQTLFRDQLQAVAPDVQWPL